MTSTYRGFSTKASVFIAVLLITPFLIRSLAPALEPYPAIVLPLGIGLFDIGENRIEVKAIQILAQNQNNEWIRIEPGKFLEPIPPYYLSKLLESKFGLIEQDSREIKTAFWGTVEVPRKPVTNKDVVSTKKWIRDKLSKLGFKDSTLRITRSVKTIRLQTDTVLNESITEEVDFELD